LGKAGLLHALPDAHFFSGDLWSVILNGFIDLQLGYLLRALLFSERLK
jgi:membrane-associated PAP2 superfamily phosphatase